MTQIPITAGRQAFGDDPQAYAAARPDYPDALYSRLVEQCGLGSGSAVFEIGPGTGIATRRLLALGASPLIAIEPDARLADYLRRALPHPALRIATEAFEDTALEPAGFDLGVAATSFHWLEQGSALAKARAALKPGGWWAMWWNNHGSEAADDAFQAATDHLFVETPASPSHGVGGAPPFALDEQARLADLADAGFEAAEAEIWRWTETYDTARLVGLYGTFSPIHALEPARRQTFMDELARIADQQFGGRVERPFTTSLYTARRPAADRRPA
jgi:trans-aconitate methyltransferase